MDWRSGMCTMRRRSRLALAMAGGIPWPRRSTGTRIIPRISGFLRRCRLCSRARRGSRWCCVGETEDAVSNTLTIYTQFQVHNKRVINCEWRYTKPWPYHLVESDFCITSSCGCPTIALCTLHMQYLRNQYINTSVILLAIPTRPLASPGTSFLRPPKP